MSSRDPQIVIVGGGPAGMMLAYQLASNGIKVRVLERHQDFKREFRGELLQASVITALQKSGIMEILIQRGLALTGIERRMFVGTRRQVRLPGPTESGAIVSQPGMLALLHELCGRYPTYKIDFGVSVTEPILANGRVVAMKTTKDGGEGRIDGDFFVVCNGRNSHLRKTCGLETEKFATTADALWLRFDFADAPQDLPKNVDVQMFGRGRVVVLQTTSGNRLHIAYSEPGNLIQLRKNLPELKRRLLISVPELLRGHIERKLSDETEWQVLKIVVDRVRSWHSKGVLFLGDAAHTMSPAGGQGLNLALRDTFAAANHIVDAVKNGREIDEALLQRIQEERQPEIDSIQARQTRAGQMVLKPLPVLHFMFTLLGMAMQLFPKKFETPGAVVSAEPKYLTRVC